MIHIMRRLNISDILNQFPEVEEAADVVPINVRQVSSSGIIPDDWLALSKTIQEVDQSHDDIDGIVITHGTATLEETAYFINLTAKTKIPIVMIGAQRPSSGFATDAAESGADERSIMAMTGHKTTQMVRRYIRDANIFKNNALNKIKL